MKTIQDGHCASRSNLSTGCPLLYGFVVLAGFVVVLGLPTSVFANDKRLGTISVRIYNHAHAPAAVLAKAEEEADKILGSAGVRPVWIDCLGQQLRTHESEICEGGWSAEFPALRLLSGKTTNEFHGFEFGFADVPVFATVSYDHIAQRAQRDAAPFELPLVLGCVMAHELGHLLLGNAKHSPTGIMQAHWGSDQVRQALTGGLLFTREESILIRERVRMSASLPKRSPNF